MPFDPERLHAAFDFDPDELTELRRRWLALLELSVWGDIKSQKIGAVPRLRKRLLEIGENLRSLVNDRGWIPQARERIKGAMAAALNLRDALLNLERAAREMSAGADFKTFEAELLEFRQGLLVFVERHEHIWAELLESQYDEPLEED